MSYKIQYKIYEVSPDGLLKEPEFNEGYGYKSSFYSYDTEDDAILAIVEKGVKYREFVILKEVSYTGPTQ